MGRSTLTRQTPLKVSREQILAFRRATGFLDERLPRTSRSLRKVAWAGLQDSMPRAAILSIHARMRGAEPTDWDGEVFVQVWGPRYSVFVVPARDRAVFTLGRLPESEKGHSRAYDVAGQLEALLDGSTMGMREAGRELGRDPNSLRYAAPTGRLLLRWDGAREPVLWMVEAPEMDPLDARRELVRRFLHIYGPSTPEAFRSWAGVTARSATEAFDLVRRSLTEVSTPIGEAWALNRDVETLLEPPGRPDKVRLLPSGDAYYLLQGTARELLVPHAGRRELLWTSRVWPGAILAHGEIVGTWRRSGRTVSASLWTRVSKSVRDAVEAEAVALPLPDEGDAAVEWH